MFCLVLGVLFSWMSWFYDMGEPSPAPAPPAGFQTVLEAPSQTPLAKPSFLQRIGNANIVALSRYEIAARILTRRTYEGDEFMPPWRDLPGVSPLALYLGWGPLSDTAIIDSFNYVTLLRDTKPQDRWGRFDDRHRQFGIQTNIIPHSPAIKAELDDLRVNQNVRLEGFLVKMEAEGLKYGPLVMRSAVKDEERYRKMMYKKNILYVTAVEVLPWYGDIDLDLAAPDDALILAASE